MVNLQKQCLTEQHRAARNNSKHVCQSLCLILGDTAGREVEPIECTVYVTNTCQLNRNWSKASS